MLSSNGSSSTCILEVFRHSYSALSRRTGAWLPQALQARQHTLRAALAQLERPPARLLEVDLADVVAHEEWARKRQELSQTQHSLTRHLRQIAAQAQQHIAMSAVAQGSDTFCQRLAPTLDTLTFAQRRALVV